MCYVQFRAIEREKGIFDEQHLEKFREMTKELPIASCRIEPNKIGIALIPDQEFIKQATGTGLDCFVENEQWGAIFEQVTEAIMESKLWEKGVECKVTNLGVWITQLRAQGDYGSDIQKPRMKYL